jgi:hypothetical protein
MALRELINPRVDGCKPIDLRKQYRKFGPFEITLLGESGIHGYEEGSVKAKFNVTSEAPSVTIDFPTLEVISTSTTSICM